MIYGFWVLHIMHITLYDKIAVVVGVVVFVKMGNLFSGTATAKAAYRVWLIVHPNVSNLFKLIEREK